MYQRKDAVADLSFLPGPATQLSRPPAPLYDSVFQPVAETPAPCMSDTSGNQLKYENIVNATAEIGALMASPVSFFQSLVYHPQLSILIQLMQI